MFDRLKAWYEGTPVESDPRSPVIFVNHYERSASSRAAHAVVDFFIKHWQWSIGIAVAIFSVLYRAH